MVMENRPVDTGSIQGNHRPISFMRIKYIENARTTFRKTCEAEAQGINNYLYIVGYTVPVVHKHHIIN